MDLFDGSDDSDGEEVPRPAACGVLQFHNGTESELLRVVAAEAPRGDVSATLAIIDRFCRSRHWMMHVGDVKGAIDGMADEVQKAKAAKQKYAKVVL